MSIHEFVCPDCSSELAFDDPQRSTTIQSGCPLCGCPIAETAFEPIEG